MLSRPRMVGVVVPVPLTNELLLLVLAPDVDVFRPPKREDTGLVPKYEACQKEKVPLCQFCVTIKTSGASVLFSPLGISSEAETYTISSSLRRGSSAESCVG